MGQGEDRAARLLKKEKRGMEKEAEGNQRTQGITKTRVKVGIQALKRVRRDLGNRSTGAAPLRGEGP